MVGTLDDDVTAQLSKVGEEVVDERVFVVDHVIHRGGLLGIDVGDAHWALLQGLCLFEFCF